MKSLLKIIPVLHGTTWIYLLSNQHLRKKISIVETAGDMVYTVLSVYSNIFLIYTNFKIMVRRTLGARLCPPSVIHSVTGIWYKVGFLRAKSTIRLIMKVL